MKKIVWFCSLGVIFLNTAIATAVNDYPIVNNTLLNVSVLAVLFMLYVVLFEKKSSIILRNISIVFGLSGLTKIIFEIISLHSFVANAILLAITTSTLIVVFLPVFIQIAIKEKD